MIQLMITEEGATSNKKKKKAGDVLVTGMTATVGTINTVLCAQ